MNILKNTETDLSLIYSEATEVLHRIDCLARVEKNPGLAILTNPIYAGFQDVFSLIGKQISHLDATDSRCTAVDRCWKQLQGCINAKRAALSQEMAEGLLSICQAAKSRAIVQRPALGWFSETDLVVFKEDAEGDLPPNGVRESELRQLLKILDEIASGRGPIRLYGSQGERRLMLQTFARLLSRPTGRKLIRFLIEKNHPIQILAAPLGKGSQAYTEAKKGPYQVFLDFKASDVVAHLACGDRQTFSSPLESTLGHELIHVRHRLDGTHASHLDKDLEDPFFTNGEEQRTITGKCKGLPDDAIHQNQILFEMRYPRREFHHCGSRAHFSDAWNLLNAAKMGITNDLRTLSTQTTLNRLDRMLEAFLVALQNNRLESVKILYPRLQEKLAQMSRAQLDQLGPFHPMALASMHGSVEVFRWLALQDRNLSYRDARGFGCVHLACFCPAKLAFLQEQGLDLLETVNGTTGFDGVCAMMTHPLEQAKAVRLFLQAKPAFIPPGALTIATYAGDTALISDLIQAGASLAFVDHQGNSPLFHAIACGCTEAVDVFLRFGSSLQGLNWQGDDAFSLAIKSGELKMIEKIHSLLQAEYHLPPLWLPAERCDPSDLNDRRSLLDRAMQRSDQKLDEELLHWKEAGLSIECIDVRGNSLLHRAIERSLPISRIEKLVAAGADIHFQHPVTGQTLLHAAAEKLHFPLIDLLLCAGANPNEVDLEGRDYIQMLTGPFLEAPSEEYLKRLNDACRKWPERVKAVFAQALAAIDPARLSESVELLLCLKKSRWSIYSTLFGLLFETAVACGCSSSVERFLAAGVALSSDLEERVASSGDPFMVQALDAYRARRALAG